MQILYRLLLGIIRRAKAIVNRALFCDRYRRVLKTCGCVCHCPVCNDILQDQADWHEYIGDEGELTGDGLYYCKNCGTMSRWHFGIAPAPICLTKFDPPTAARRASPAATWSGIRRSPHADPRRVE